MICEKCLDVAKLDFVKCPTCGADAPKYFDKGNVLTFFFLGILGVISALIVVNLVWVMFLIVFSLLFAFLPPFAMLLLSFMAIIGGTILSGFYAIKVIGKWWPEKRNKYAFATGQIVTTIIIFVVLFL